MSLRPPTCASGPTLLSHAAKSWGEEPDAGILHVRICGGLGWATTQAYPAIYERPVVKRGGADIVSRGSRTSPSPSASVDLAHLRQIFYSSSPVFDVSPFAMGRDSSSSWNPGATS